MITKKQMILIAIAIIVITLVAVVFSSFGYYKVDIYPSGAKKVLVRKIKNENMFMNFFKPAAETALQQGDLIVYKSPLLHDPAFKEKENFYGRIIGLPGDVVVIKDSKVFVNNTEIKEDYFRYYLYRISMPDSTDFKALLGKFDIEIISILNQSKACDFIAVQAIANDISKIKGAINVRKIIETTSQGNSDVSNTFGSSWNKDNFGPVVVPQQGVTVLLNSRNYMAYKDIIGFYENHNFHAFGDKITIDAKPADKYIIEDNYYFVLADNRYNRPDSRTIGFIPESYIIGKVVE